ncbi:MAG: shikimate kinase [Candidatus Binatia bacterium]
MLQTSQRNIVLIGFMAVGKSAVGQKLALSLKRPFVDLDQAIEDREGVKVEQIFARKGEAYFRRAEKETMKEVLSRDGQVIATGGGAVMDTENLRLLKQRSILISLTAPPETLLRRSGSGNQRPLLKEGDRQGRIEELLTQRERVYRQAHFSIDTEQLSVDEVVKRIMEVLARGIAKNKMQSE